MYRKIVSLSFVESKKWSFSVSLILVMCLVGSVLGAEEYIWTGDGLDGKWNTAGNWDHGRVPPHNCEAVSILYSEDNISLVITIPAGSAFL